MDRIEWHWCVAMATPGSFTIRFAPWPPICRHPDPVQACRACGCWQYDACVDEESEEPCHWEEPDLCSACARRGADRQTPAGVREPSARAQRDQPRLRCGARWIS